MCLLLLINLLAILRSYTAHNKGVYATRCSSCLITSLCYIDYYNLIYFN